MHQDAHEFLNYLLNQIVEEIENERKNILNGVNGEDSGFFAMEYLFLLTLCQCQAQSTLLVQGAHQQPELLPTVRVLALFVQMRLLCTNSSKAL